MSVQQSITEFIKAHEEATEKLNILKSQMKQESSKRIQQHVMKEEYDQVSQLVSQLDAFTKLTYESNHELILQQIEQVFGKNIPTSSSKYEENTQYNNVDWKREWFEQADYEIIHSDTDKMKVKKDRFQYQLQYDNGALKKNQYMKFLNTYAKEKSIGFLCINEKAKEEAKKIATEWGKNNPAKTTFLKIHFITVDELQNNHMFETISY